MKDTLIKYITNGLNNVPIGVSLGLLLVFCLGSFLLLACMGLKKGIKWSEKLLLLIYLLWVLFSTVCFREVMLERKYHLVPFKVLRAFQAHNYYSLSECLMNVVAFIPIGVLLGRSFNRRKWLIVIMIGFGFSILIEILQFFLKRGFAELDDVFHNVLGCVIGLLGFIVVDAMVKEAVRQRKDFQCE